MVSSSTVQRIARAACVTVQGNSMVPALGPGHRVLVDCRAYRDAPPARGDVVLFRHHLPEMGDFLKRIVALPGEHVHLKEGQVFINGVALEERYASSPTAAPPGTPSQWFVGEGQYFVLGDNRGDSYDSRRFGPVDAGQILGKAWLRLWPPRAWGSIR
ncbi:MAG: signal peptidase I [Chloroflexi bacterium]|nr:signal peptidase I [Chloroflexota bacterium]